MHFIGELFAGALGEIIEWLFGKLPKRLQAGCLVVFGAALLALLIWYLAS